MPEEAISTRISRLYAAVDALTEVDMRKLPGKIVGRRNTFGLLQDFSGELSCEEMTNTAYMLIHNTANLRDHLRRWASQHGKDKARVDATFQESEALKVVQDLSNNDKHGYPPRDGGYSRVAPRLESVRRVLRISGEPNSSIYLTLGANGIPEMLGDGDVKAVITSEVLDDQGLA